MDGKNPRLGPCLEPNEYSTDSVDYYTWPGSQLSVATLASMLAFQFIAGEDLGHFFTEAN